MTGPLSERLQPLVSELADGGHRWCSAQLIDALLLISIYRQLILGEQGRDRYTSSAAKSTRSAAARGDPEGHPLRLTFDQFERRSWGFIVFHESFAVIIGSPTRGSCARQ